jgi:general secretion pathway protein L
MIFPMFFNWWGKQLSDLIPDGMMPMLHRNADSIILEIDRSHAALLTRRNGGISQLGRASATEAGFRQLAEVAANMEAFSGSLALRLPAGSLLQKEVALPIGARRNLKTLLRFEMDRETPFTPDEVYWNYAVNREDPVMKRLIVDLFIAPRFVIDPVVKAIEAAGLQVDRIEIDNPRHGISVIQLKPRRRWQWISGDRPLTALTATAAALSMFAIAIPFIRQNVALASAEASIKSLTEQAQAAGIFSQPADRTADAVGLVEAERQRNSNTLSAFAAITRLLPENSYLTTLTLRSGRFTISGVSPSAAHLIDLLAKSGTFSEPAFEAPVVQNETGSLETFTISATLPSAGRS